MNTALSLDAPSAIVRRQALKPTARERLLREAADLFSRKGYASTSVGEIVAAAGVSKPVLYYHFKNKEGLYLQLMEHGLALLRGMVESALRSGEGGASERIVRLCQAAAALAVENVGIVRLTQWSLHAPPQSAPSFDVCQFHHIILGAIRELVDQGLRSGEFRPVPREDLVWAIVGLLSAFIESNLGDPALALKAEGFRSALELVLSGALPAGRRNEGAC